MSAHFRLVAAGGQVLDEGDATATMEGGALVVAPQVGQPIRVRPTEVAGVAEPQPFVVAIRLREGPTLELSRLGAMRTQLLAELGEARADDTVHTLLLTGVGTPERFPGAIGEVEAELRLYDDSFVAVLQTGEPVQLPYSFVDAVTTDPSGYRISIETGEGPPIAVTRLARRTSEFVDLLRKRVTLARGRTSAFLGALLPGLGPIALRSVGGQLRDGIAAWRPDLDGVEPTVWQALTEASTLPERIGCRTLLEQTCEVALGFHQRTTVEAEASGGQAYRPPPASVAVADHDHTTGGMGRGLGAGGGMGGMMAMAGMDMLPGGPLAQMGLGFGASFGGGGAGSMLAMQMLGTGMLGGMGGGMPGARANQAHQEMPRDAAGDHRGTLTPGQTDYGALGVSGGEPTVLAFMFCVSRQGLVLYEVLNEGDHATYVYRASRADVRELNRALMLVNFRVESIYSDTSTVGSAYRQAAERLPSLQRLRSGFVERVIHTEGWEGRIHQLT